MDEYRDSNGRWNFHPEYPVAYLIDAPVGTSEKKIVEVLLRLHPGRRDNLEEMVHQAIISGPPYLFGSKKELVLDGGRHRWVYGAEWMIRNGSRPKDWIIPIYRYLLTENLALI